MLILDLSFHLQANKSPVYRERITNIFLALASFIDEQDFATRRLKEAIDQDPWTFRLESCDLTSDGMTWVRDHLDRWMGRMDRRTSQTRFDDYMKSLRKILD